MGSSTKPNLIMALTSHHCSLRCQDVVYIFKEMPVERRNVVASFSHVIDDIPVHSRINEGTAAGTENSNVSNSEARVPREANIHISLDVPGAALPSIDHLAPCGLTRKASIIRQWQKETSTEALKHLVCAICSVKVIAIQSNWVDSASVNLSLLRNDLLDECLRPTEYDFFVYERALLDPRGLQYTDRLGHMRVCDACYKSLGDEKMPKFALSNWLYYAREQLPLPVKNAFNDATIFDKMMISKARCNSICCKFSLSKNEEFTPQNDSVLARARKGIRGNVLVSPLNVIQMNNVLPPGPQTIQDTMCAMFVSDTMPSRSTIKRFSPILVRKSRIKSMISFLLAHNGHYQLSDGLQFSQSNLDALFDQGEDEGLASSVHVGHLPHNDAVEGATSDYTPRNIDLESLHSTVDDEILMENVGYTDGDDSPASYHAMKEAALRHCLQSKPFLVSASGASPLPDYNNPAILTWLFPHLDPWGIGGFHHPGRARRLSMEEQVSHLLKTADSPFERDPEFSFVFFNVLRKSMVSKSLRFCTPQATHRLIVQNLMSINPEVLIQMNKLCKDDPRFKPETEEQKKAFGLLQSLRLVAKHVPGSDGYKIMMRNQIRGMINHRATPTLFITLSPSDVDNPIVRLFTGEDIIIEDICRGEDMSSWKRKLLAAHNPGACALFFDLIITKFIEIVLRYKSSDGPGLFGTCDAYFATVEAQGKGTLHCHMLVWLNGHLSPQELRDTMTNSEEYKNRVFQWLESSIKCEFPYSEASPTIQSDRAERVLHKDTGNPHPAVIAAPRIPEKEDEMNDFWIHFKEYVNLLLYKYNWHEHQPTCWKYLKRGQEKIDANCRMGMNGETRPSTSLDPATASILLRRLHPKIASHSDVATFILQCNTDLKFVGSGEAAKSFLYYVTDYITKSSLQVHVGMAALSYAIKKIYSKTPDVLASGSENQTCGAVITAVNAMMGRHEISQPQVMSYLIGGGDHYTSEVFTVINWGLISGAVRAFWADVEDNMAESYRPEPTVNVQSDAQARITVSNQLLNYQFRSVNPNFNDLNLYDFGAYTKKVSHTSGVDISTRSGCFNGRGHPQQHSHLLSIRSVEHVPVLLGPSFANPSTSEDAREKWSRDMLILFKPWRNPDELKTRDATWCQAFDAYQHNFSPRSQKIIKNMTVLTECSDARHIRPHAEQANDPEANLNTDHENAEANDTTEHMTLYPDDLDPYTFGIFTVASTNLDPSTDHADQRDKHLIQKIGPEVHLWQLPEAFKDR